MRSVRLEEARSMMSPRTGVTRSPLKEMALCSETEQKPGCHSRHFAGGEE